ncbi:hypothetical protein F5Y03DRAFT_49865 [Xylaria venustula]|nr:hypothetical protein F5Y03DRAFT_49865 [Xylaria venustula]
MREHLIRAELSVEDAHVQHCFNYLRQSLMCNVDLQLNIRGGDELVGFEDEVHVCRDYNAIVRWLDANRYLASGIGIVQITCRVSRLKWEGYGSLPDTLYAFLSTISVIFEVIYEEKIAIFRIER